MGGSAKVQSFSIDEVTKNNGDKVMCGIAGMMCINRINCDVGAAERLIKDMTDTLVHRGPDGEGQVVLDDGHVFLGHRRLSIIDLSSAASQPMQSMDKRYTISYNGEIYNYRELRKELEGKGYRFFSASDTEVILNAYAEWGTGSLLKLNGIFAFAIWDNYKKVMLLARDRYGTKPLYYTKIGNQLVFASEYKAIMQHPEFEHKINLCAVKQYFTFQNIFDTQTFFCGINLLKAGSYLRLSYDMEEIPEPTTWWDFNFTEGNEKISEQEYYEELDRLFKQAVTRQLVSDVDVGTYLSGGVDSGSITAIAAQRIPYMKTFTCGFDLHSASGVELSYDEREKAEYMSYCFKTEHYEMVLKSGDMERCIHDLVWHLEDPRVGQSYPNYYAAKLSSQFVKVILAGTGGDEIFAGYPWRYYRAVDSRDFNDYINKYYHYWQRLLNDDEMQEVFAPIYGTIRDYSMKETFRKVFDNCFIEEFTPAQSINYSLYLEAKTFLHGLLLVEDKISMAYGLETRVPFLDNDLVDFAMKIPVEHKLSSLSEVIAINENDYERKKDKYFQKTKDGKYILRNVMKKYIPEEISGGVKQGFSAPDSSWFKGESIDFCNSIIEDANSRIYSFMDKKAVRSIFNRHLTGKENKRLFIWSLLNFEEWLRIFD